MSLEKILALKNKAQLDKMSSERLGDYGVYDGGLLVEAQAIADMTVKVSAGVCYMPTTFQRYSIAATASLAVTAADATNPRYDIVYVSSAGVVSYLAGTAAASPSVPATPSGAVKLAELYVTAGKTSIVAGDITLRRWFLESGGWTTWTPTLTWATATPGGIATTARYKVIGKTLFFIVQVYVADGNGATDLNISLPILPKALGVVPQVICTTTINGTAASKIARIRDDGVNNDLDIMTLGTFTDAVASSARLTGFYEIA